MVDPAPPLQLLTTNLETKDKGSKLIQYLIKFYLIDHQHKQLQDLSKSLSAVRKIMKLTLTCKGLTNLSISLATDDTARKILDVISLMVYFAGDINTLMILGFKLPWLLKTIGKQLKYIWFLKNWVVLYFTIESDLWVDGDISWTLLKTICDLYHGTYRLDWQSNTKLSFIAAMISSCVCLRDEIVKVDWSALVDQFEWQTKLKKTSRRKQILMRKYKVVKTKKSRKEQKRATTPPAEAMPMLEEQTTMRQLRQYQFNCNTPKPTWSGASKDKMCDMTTRPAGGCTPTCR